MNEWLIPDGCLPGGGSKELLAQRSALGVQDTRVWSFPDKLGIMTTIVPRQPNRR